MDEVDFGMNPLSGKDSYQFTPRFKEWFTGESQIQMAMRRSPLHRRDVDIAVPRVVYELWLALGKPPERAPVAGSISRRELTRRRCKLGDFVWGNVAGVRTDDGWVAPKLPKGLSPSDDASDLVRWM